MARQSCGEMPEQDDALLAKFLEGVDLTEEEIPEHHPQGHDRAPCGPGLLRFSLQKQGRPTLARRRLLISCRLPKTSRPSSGRKVKDRFTASTRLTNPSRRSPQDRRDKHMGKLTYMRVYSGVIKSGTVVYNSKQNKEQRIGRLLRMHANRQESIDEARCGDIVAVIGLQQPRPATPCAPRTIRSCWNPSNSPRP